MKVSIEQLKRVYLFTAVFYYFGFMNFVSRFVSGGKAEDLMSANAAGSLAKQLVGVLLLGLSIFLLLKVNKKLLYSMLKASYWWAIIIGFFALSIYWSYEPSISFRRLIAFITLIVVSFCLVCTFEPKSLLYFLAKTIFVAAILGLMLMVIAPNMALQGSGDRANMFVGIMGDKNGGARLYAYAILILAGLGRYQTRQDKFKLFILSVCLVFANSATAIVMVVAGLGLILLFKVLHTRSANMNLRRFFLITVLLMLASMAAYFLYAFLLELLGRDPTLTNRTVIWELLSESIDKKPWLGYGFGAFWSSDAVLGFVERWGFIGNAHSGYYETLLNGGIIGLVLMVLLSLKIIK
ncbi:O-antigen ligase, partial [Paraglaciecola sp.]|uniref:O-antigen ligase family protein n=1 Tax=Paraglaciecola sp. TaxID=1920173 RepID=UPI00273DFC9A